jgi:hypothetical protein
VASAAAKASAAGATANDAMRQANKDAVRWKCINITRPVHVHCYRVSRVILYPRLPPPPPHPSTPPLNLPPPPSPPHRPCPRPPAVHTAGAARYKAESKAKAESRDMRTHTTRIWIWIWIWIWMEERGKRRSGRSSEPAPAVACGAAAGVPPSLRRLHIHERAVPSGHGRQAEQLRAQ